VGVFALVATAQGLWVGSDTKRIGRYEHHARSAFMPLAGGTAVPESQTGTLPGDPFRLGLDGATAAPRRPCPPGSTGQPSAAPSWSAAASTPASLTAP
jgi:hypothetical protein